MGMYCFGIDVGGTSVKCGLFLTNGTLVEQWEIPTRLENNGSSILPDVADAIKTKLDERGITKDNVDGVGIGIPGPVNENGEVPMAVNLHWGFKAVASELSALTGLPAKAANDANIAALGDFRDFLQSCVWVDEKETGIFACMKRFNAHIRPLVLDGVQEERIPQWDLRVYRAVVKGWFPQLYVLLRVREKLTKKKWGIRR